MSNILTKSNQNFEAGDLLCNEHKYFSTATHCYYYSVFQFLTHILSHCLDKVEYKATLEDYEKNGKGLGSHNWLTEFFLGDLFRKKRFDQESWKNEDMINEFEDDLKDLKGKRVLVDYKEDIITEPEVHTLRKKANKLRSDLEKAYASEIEDYNNLMDVDF